MRQTTTVLQVSTAALLALAEAQQLCPHLNLHVYHCAALVQSLLRTLSPLQIKRYEPPTVEVVNTSWDPDPEAVPGHIEVSRCRALLLEIIRRAAHDWVLYRMSTKLDYKQIAEEARTWLFEEEEGHPNWLERNNNERYITAFVAICDALDLEPEVVRDRVRKMTIKSIMGAGRPAEKRHLQVAVEDMHYEEHGVMDIHMEELESYEDGYRSQYESQFSVPSYA